VRGSINGFAFRSSLFPVKNGGHFLLVNNKMKIAAKVSLGSKARFELEPDIEDRVAQVPAELARTLDEDGELRGWFQGLNYSTRYDIGNWIQEPKSAAARERRADQMAERLLSVMGAELELPPLIRNALANDRSAREGWQRMSPSHRRAHLFAIFYYRDPTSRARRVAKMIDEARRFAEKKAKT
jgi:uncharacterized protein YdeI (YjbR/CyaY-like superfamily)